jgi:hypothetical protein
VTSSSVPLSFIYGSVHYTENIKGIRTWKMPYWINNNIFHGASKLQEKNTLAFSNWTLQIKSLTCAKITDKDWMEDSQKSWFQDIWHWQLSENKKNTHFTINVLKRNIRTNFLFVILYIFVVTDWWSC